MKYILVAVLLCIAIRVNVVESLSGGAPAEACETLSPDPDSHMAQPQTTPVPYVVNISSLYDGGRYVYDPGETYTCKCTIH